MTARAVLPRMLEADVVGYSRLMATDRIRRACVRRIRAVFYG